jgi:NAD(P)-dependent dehydrogenase (short-subunit alcohol dehydrogenase family)
MTEALRVELAGGNVGVSLVLPGVVDTPMAAAAALDPKSNGFWPSRLNMPTAWVVWAVFASVRFRLAEVAVPPGGALLEKLAALTPGGADVLIRGVTNLVRRLGRAD